MIFLHGGGDDPAARPATFGHFVRAAGPGSSCRLALVAAGDTLADARASLAEYRQTFESLPQPPGEILPLPVTPAQPPGRAWLERERPSAVFVCGGSTPLYHRALCQDPAWAGFLAAAGIPYGGTSAGAMIAAQQAILGGWQVARGGVRRAMLFQGAAEGLDALDVRPGLDLVPFAVDAHASQMGTLARLVHAVDTGLVVEGWAIDENTALVVTEGTIRVIGLGHAYHVWRENGTPLQVTVHTA